MPNCLILPRSALRSARRLSTCVLAACLAALLAFVPAVSRAQGLAPEDGPPPGIVYTVQAGDNLTVIARRYGTRVEALVAANHLPDASLIFVGQRLRIPVLPIRANTTVAPSDRKGLAMATHFPEDLETLGVAWYYTWGWCHAPGCVPMVHGMELPPACPPLLLVGNEP